MNKQTVLRNTIAATITAGALGVAGVSLAQADDETSAAPAALAERPGPGHGGPFGPGDDLTEALGVTEDELRDALRAIREDRGDERPERGEIASALAAELGLTEDEVTAAFEKARTTAEADRRELLSDRLDDAVEDGDLTEADKASVLKAFDAGVLSPRRR